MQCPSCDKAIVRLSEGPPRWAGLPGEEFLVGVEEGKVLRQVILYPRVPFTRPLPSEVPTTIRQDFEEALIVLPFSPKASAALSRRCLQNILVDAGQVKSKDLAPQIEEAVKVHGFTAGLRRMLTAVRMVGNYAAHPIKDKSTGVIVDVEPGEAELNLSALTDLIDYFYVRPAEEQKQLDEINKKLVAAGKPPIA